MEALSTEVKKLAHAADEHGRKKLLNELRDLAYSIESPDDSVQRIMYQVADFPAILAKSKLTPFIGTTNQCSESGYRFEDLRYASRQWRPQQPRGSGKGNGGSARTAW